MWVEDKAAVFFWPSSHNSKKLVADAHDVVEIERQGFLQRVLKVLNQGVDAFMDQLEHVCLNPIVVQKTVDKIRKFVKY